MLFQQFDGSLQPSCRLSCGQQVKGFQWGKYSYLIIPAGQSDPRIKDPEVGQHQEPVDELAQVLAGFRNGDWF